MKTLYLLLFAILMAQGKLLACGLCATITYQYLMPFYPFWVAIYFIWLLFSLKYYLISRKHVYDWTVFFIITIIFSALISIDAFALFYLLWLIRAFKQIKFASNQRNANEYSIDPNRISPYIHLQLCVIVIFSLTTVTIACFHR